MNSSVINLLMKSVPSVFSCHQKETWSSTRGLICGVHHIQTVTSTKPNKTILDGIKHRSVIQSNPTLPLPEASLITVPLSTPFLSICTPDIISVVSKVVQIASWPLATSKLQSRLHPVAKANLQSCHFYKQPVPLAIFFWLFNQITSLHQFFPTSTYGYFDFCLF